jgi:hypothetical protein
MVNKSRTTVSNRIAGSDRIRIGILIKDSENMFAVI